MSVAWVAVYNDGRTLHQYEGDWEHSSEEIDRSRLVSIRLVDQDSQSVIVEQFFKKGVKVIFRRRVEQSPGGGTRVAYLLGWEKDDLCHISLVKESIFGWRVEENHVGYSDSHPWLHPIVFVPADEVVVG